MSRNGKAVMDSYSFYIGFHTEHLATTSSFRAADSEDGDMSNAYPSFRVLNSNKPLAVRTGPHPRSTPKLQLDMEIVVIIQISRDLSNPGYPERLSHLARTLMTRDSTVSKTRCDIKLSIVITC